MQMKGNLDSVDLGQLFRALAEEAATGVLTVRGELGEKRLALARGKIRLLTQLRGSHPMRLGDLLVARGDLSVEQLKEVLEEQQRRPGAARRKLGELLVEKGLVTENRIRAAVRFQIEEELLELFTWRSGEFEFRKMRASEVEQEGESLPVQLETDPAELIAHSAERLDEWQLIQRRVPSPNLVFKTTPAGEAAEPDLAAAARQVLRLVREERTVDTMVRRSCLGRITTCKTLIKLIEDGHIIPYPAGDLKFLASEHRVRRNYHDAIGVYRRLLELSPAPEERKTLQKAIDDVLQAMALLKEEDEAESDLARVEGYMQAAWRVKRRRQARRIALLLAGGLVAIGLVLLGAAQPWKKEARPPPLQEPLPASLAGQIEKCLPDNYAAAIGLIENWRETPAASGYRRQDVQRWIGDLRLGWERHLRRQLARFATPTRADRESLATLLQQAKECQGPQSLDLVEEANRKLATIDLATEDWAAALLQEAEEECRRNDLRRALLLSQGALPGFGPQSPRRRAAEALLAHCQTRLQEGAALFAGAESRLGEGKYQEAKAEYEKLARQDAITTFNGTEIRGAPYGAAYGRLAAERLQELNSRLEAAEEAPKLVENRRRSLLAARQLCLQKLVEFADVRVAAAELQRQLSQIESELTLIGKEWETLRQALRSDPQRAAVLACAFVTQRRAYLLESGASVPVFLDSLPGGAQIVLGDQVVAQTPHVLFLPFNTALRLTVRMPGYGEEVLHLHRPTAEQLQHLVRLRLRPLKTLQVQGPVTGKVLEHRGRLFIPAADHLMIVSAQADDLRSGTLLSVSGRVESYRNERGREVVISRPDTWGWLRQGPRLGPEDSLLWGTRDGTLLHLDAEGRVCARVKLAVPANGNPLLIPIRLYSRSPEDLFFFAAGYDGRLHVYPAQTDAAAVPQWQKNEPRGFRYIPPLVYAGPTSLGAGDKTQHVYAFCSDGQLRVYDPQKPEGPAETLPLPVAPEPERQGIFQEHPRRRFVCLTTEENLWSFDLAERKPEQSYRVAGLRMSDFVPDGDDAFVLGEERAGERRWWLHHYSFTEGSGLAATLLPHPAVDLAITKTRVLVVCHKGKTSGVLLGFDRVRKCRLLWETELPGDPTSISVSPDQKRQYVSTMQGHIVVFPIP